MISSVIIYTTSVVNEDHAFICIVIEKQYNGYYLTNRKAQIRAIRATVPTTDDTAIVVVLSV